MTVIDNTPTKRPFRTVLIANRGEIALRIIRTARRLGYRTVAIYSEADASSRHVKAADMAVPVGPSSPLESYLNINRVLEAARLSGAEAVHPGYGFLSENAEFADACVQAGLVFIGPTGDMIRRMGDKAAAKKVMLAAGVPCIPGYEGDDQSVERLEDEARRIGLPVMIKAVAGGGGRGMRLVERQEQFVQQLASARSEATSAFGDERVLLERAILQPRHIEVQVFGDRHGNAIHLFERDCSVQRRHQKLVEEAPSPFLDEGLRERICEAALTAVRAVGYEGAGTLEFLVDDGGDFWFMEMNTRLQVEHPVTEMITGLDLVELQFRVASGAPLGIAQDEVPINGHSIEVRLCAEDPNRDFIPQSGHLGLWRMPQVVRVESGVQSGDEVSPFYDSMLAKLISHGASRDEARGQLLAGLDEAVTFGIATNRTFLRRVIADQHFADGSVHTGFIAARLPELVAPVSTAGEAVALAALVLHLTEGAVDTGWFPHPLTQSFSVPMRLRSGADDLDAVVRFEGGQSWCVDTADFAGTVIVRALSTHEVCLHLGEVTEKACYLRHGDRLWLKWRGQDIEVDNVTYRAECLPADSVGNGILRASMTGQIIALHAKAGESLLPGQPVVTVEAMKMEHAHCADIDGQLVELFVKVGDQVSVGQVLAQMSAGTSGEERQ